MSKYWKHRDGMSFIIINECGNTYVDKAANDLMFDLMKEEFDTYDGYDHALLEYLVSSDSWENVTECIYSVPNHILGSIKQ